jgi:hypothetical protein
LKIRGGGLFEIFGHCLGARMDVQFQVDVPDVVTPGLKTRIIWLWVRGRISFQITPSVSDIAADMDQMIVTQLM